MNDTALWGWFGLSRASFLTIPRVLLHEMPKKWQDKMAALLYEYDEAFPNRPDLDSFVVVKDKTNRFVRMPEWMTNYRHPMKGTIKKLRGNPTSKARKGADDDRQ